jgi:hypothetical protein
MQGIFMVGDEMRTRDYVGRERKAKPAIAVITDFGVGLWGKEPENSKAVGSAGCPAMIPVSTAPCGSPPVALTARGISQCNARF